MRGPALALLAAVALACSGERTPVERALAEHASQLQGFSSTRQELRLECLPSDAEILVDGVLQGLCSDFAAQGIGLDDAPHHVEVRRPGFSPFFTAVQAGRARTGLKIELRPVN